LSAALLLLMAAGGTLIGFLLAVLGAGGSILLLPLLISGAGLPTREAVPLSLLAVTLLAAANAGPYLRRRQVAPGPALVLGVPALAGSWIGGSLVKHGLIPEPVQLALFAAAALVAAWLLTRQRRGSSRGDGPGGGGRWRGGRRPCRQLYPPPMACSISSQQRLPRMPRSGTFQQRRRMVWLRATVTASRARLVMGLEAPPPSAPCP
jgi:uncharacterized membrane protein YfcA